ncbi:MAG: ABC transporter permease, partial [Gammaproteobacteria bacterium]|nr:ABC transporter permease [Gammaproteobacteria bacterium]
MTIVGVLYIILAAMFVWSIIHGQKVIRTERTDAVFGNPIRTMGGWHWVICGVSSLMLFWLTFSWDAGKAFFPEAANELCQVAKLNRAVKPIRSAYPLDNRYLLSTRLLERDFKQIDLLYVRLSGTDFNSDDREELNDIINLMRDVLAAQADPKFISPDTEGRFKEIADRINRVADDLLDEGYPGPADPKLLEEALAQPGWGESSTEIP